MLAGELCSSKLRREAGCWERKKQSSSKSSCAGMPEDLANTVWGTGSDSLQLGSCYSVFGAALHCSTCPPLQDTIERPIVCLNTLLSLWSPDLMLHVFFFFPFFSPDYWVLHCMRTSAPFQAQLSRCRSLHSLMQGSVLETFSLASGSQVASVHIGCKSSAVQGWSRNWL